MITSPVRGEGGTPLSQQQHLYLSGVSWADYLRFRETVPQQWRVTYIRGEIEIMPPLPEHESVKTVMSRLLEILLMELGIESETYGSTTFFREDEDVGLEPDSCYYIEHAADVRSMMRWDAAKYPPPDLVIEVDITRRSLSKLPAYEALRVPEVWRWHGDRLVVHILGERGYAEQERSRALPRVSIPMLREWVNRYRAAGPKLPVIREFQTWCRTL